MQESIQNLAVNGVTRVASALGLSDIEPGFVDRVADILLALSDQSEDLRAKIALEQTVQKFRRLSEALESIEEKMALEFDRGFKAGRRPRGLT